MPPPTHRNHQRQTLAAASAPAPAVSSYEVLHQICKRHVRQGNPTAVLALLSLPALNADRDFWLSCDWAAGMASACLACVVESSGESQQAPPLATQQLMGDDVGDDDEHPVLGPKDVYVLCRGVQGQYGDESHASGFGRARTCGSTDGKKVPTGTKGDEEEENRSSILRPTLLVLPVVRDAIEKLRTGNAQIDLVALCAALQHQVVEDCEPHLQRVQELSRSPLQTSAGVSPPEKEGGGVSPIGAAVLAASTTGKKRPRDDAASDSTRDDDDGLDPAASALQFDDEEEQDADDGANKLSLCQPVRDSDDPEDDIFAELGEVYPDRPGAASAAATVKGNSADNKHADKGKQQGGAENGDAGDDGAGLSTSNKRRPWTADEDKAIMEGMVKFRGQHRFTDLFAHYKSRGVWQSGRTATHVADHWRQALRTRTLRTSKADV